MARGRKRRILGWGLVAFGVAALLVFALSGGRHFCVDFGKVFLSSTQGNLSAGWTTYEWERGSWSVNPISPSSWSGWRDGDRSFVRGWFYTARTNFWGADYGRVVVVRLWPPAVALIIGGWLLMRWGRRLLRASTSLCRTCGYDLAGLPPSTPCPECGPPTPIPLKAEAQPVRG